MVTAGTAAPAYQAVCDTTLGAMELVAAFASERQADDQAEELAAPPTIDEEAVGRAAAAVVSCVQASDVPVPGSTAAAAALRAVPEIARTRWAGTGGFAAFVQKHTPKLRFVSTSSGGRVVDPTRHTTALDPVDEQPTDVAARVARVTKVPLLSSEQYAVLFQNLAEVAKVEQRLARIGSDVRERAADTAAPVPRKSVDFVLMGLVYAGSDPRTTDLDARGLAEKWLANVFFRCDEAGLELDDLERKATTAWITGRLPE